MLHIKLFLFSLTAFCQNARQVEVNPLGEEMYAACLRVVLLCLTTIEQNRLCQKLPPHFPVSNMQGAKVPRKISHPLIFFNKYQQRKKRQLRRKIMNKPCKYVNCCFHKISMLTAERVVSTNLSSQPDANSDQFIPCQHNLQLNFILYKLTNASSQSMVAKDSSTCASPMQILK